MKLSILKGRYHDRWSIISQTEEETMIECPGNLALLIRQNYVADVDFSLYPSQTKSMFVMKISNQILTWLLLKFGEPGVTTYPPNTTFRFIPVVIQ